MPSNKIRETFSRAAEDFMQSAGDFVEHSIGNKIAGSSLEAPALMGEMSDNLWYKLPLEGALSGDGSEYHIYLRRGRSKNLCIFFSGGGVAWNEYTAARPVTGGRVAAWQPNFYWNNLRPFTQIMNINIGITDMDERKNPFFDWSFVVITYATGDFHVGDRAFPYTDEEDGSQKLLHFHGYKNFIESMDAAALYFPNPQKLLIAGDSAGAFAVPALSDIILSKYYKSCADVTLLSDSALLKYDGWAQTARDVWRAPDEICSPLTTDNIALDWYRSLAKKRGSSLRYLYASSTHDYLLSAYYNDMENKSYMTDSPSQAKFYMQLCEMAKALKDLNVGFGFFINDWKNRLYTKGGTVHTAVRQPYFYQKTKSGVTMAEWLFDAACGKIYDEGMELLQ